MRLKSSVGTESLPDFRNLIETDWFLWARSRSTTVAFEKKLELKWNVRSGRLVDLTDKDVGGVSSNV